MTGISGLLQVFGIIYLVLQNHTGLTYNTTVCTMQCVVPHRFGHYTHGTLLRPDDFIMFIWQCQPFQRKQSIQMHDYHTPLPLRGRGIQLLKNEVQTCGIHKANAHTLRLHSEVKYRKIKINLQSKRRQFRSRKT